MSRILPFDRILAQHVVALGKTRSGKSSKLRVLVEWLLDHRRPVTIIDPKGDWYGLKSSADGKEPGYPIVIFGGEHADVPINDRSGAQIAEIIAAGNRPCLIDLGGWMIAERTRFFIDFAGTLFKLTKGNRFLVIDEVHNFAPKGRIMDPQAGKMLHWANRLASEGQGKGLVLLAASQRPQKVHNDFLTSCETLIACRLTHKADRDAVKDWMDGCADPAIGKQMISGIAQMPRTHAWVWSPEIDFGPKEITFPLFHTFDSFKPRGADDEVKLKGWAEVDLQDLTVKLASLIEEAKAQDPDTLKKTIGELQQRIRVLEKGTNEADLEARIIAAVDAALRDSAEEHRNRFQKHIKTAQDVLSKTVDDLLRAIETLTLPQEAIPKFVPKTPRKAGVSPVSAARYPDFTAPKSRQAEGPGPGEAVYYVPDKEGRPTLSAPEQKILNSLAWWGATGLGEPYTKIQVATIAGYTLSGAFSEPCASLRKKGFIEYVDGKIQMTLAGGRWAAHPDKPTRKVLHDRVRDKLNGPETKLLNVLLSCYPESVVKSELAERAGYKMSGAFSEPMASLRSLGLATYPTAGAARAADFLFAL
jgi:hypothetical protein